MHFCGDELMILLLVIDRGIEHAWRYTKACGLYACSCARCLVTRIMNGSRER